jgi:hypothetical protein
MERLLADQLRSNIPPKKCPHSSNRDVSMQPWGFTLHMTFSLRTTAEKKRRENTTPFGINLMRSQVLHTIAHKLYSFPDLHCDVSQQATSHMLSGTYL